MDGCCQPLTEHQGNAYRRRKKRTPEFFDACQITFLDPLKNKTVGCEQAQAVRNIILAFETKGANPGIELLRRKFVFELAQAGDPETTHD